MKLWRVSARKQRLSAHLAVLLLVSLSLDKAQLSSPHGMHGLVVAAQPAAAPPPPPSRQAPFQAPPNKEEQKDMPGSPSSNSHASLDGKATVQGHNYYAQLSAAPGKTEAREQHVAVLKALTALPGRVSIRHKFGADPDDVLNVISFRIEGNRKGLEDVANVQGVIGIYPVRTRKRPKTVPLGSLQYTKPSLDSAHILTGVKDIHDRPDITGKGIKVGIIDTGVDYRHPALGGCFGPGCKVAYGYDFVGDAYDNSDSEKDRPRPDSDPMDCAGHGTHVAGIVAARNQAPHMLGDQEFVGVAPDVTLGAYRVFGCDGEVSDDVLLAALKQAYRDGMDIVNLSLGGASGWPEEPFAMACSAYIQRGLHIAIANGNDGEEGLFEDGAPATANGAVAVGSVDNTHFLGTAGVAQWMAVDALGQVVGHGGKTQQEGAEQDKEEKNDDGGTGAKEGLKIQFGVTMASDNNDVPVAEFARNMAYVLEIPPETNNQHLGCGGAYVVPATRPRSVQSHQVIVLLKRGMCSFTDKATVVKDAKLGGMLVYDTVPEQRPLGMAITGVNISAGGLAYEDAQALIAAATAKQPNQEEGSGTTATTKLFTIQFQPGAQLLRLRSGGKMSDFSSWGPDARLRYKPDIVSPGGLIYSTFPLAKGGFATLQGTSMASPYMAGIMALYLSKYGKTAPEHLLRLMQSTAVPTEEPGWSSSSSSSNQNNKTLALSSVFQQGGGLVSVGRLFAETLPTVVEPTTLFLNDTQFQKLTHTVTLQYPSGTSGSDRVYTLQHRPALSVNAFDEHQFNAPVNQSRIRRSAVGIESVVMTPERVVVRPGQTVQVEFSFRPPTALRVEERWLVSGFLELACQVEDMGNQGTTGGGGATAAAFCDSVLLSYGGMHGHLASVPILNPVVQYPALELDRLIGPLEEEAAKKQDEEKTLPPPTMYRDRSQSIQVGHDDQDWLRILIAVNFPTDLLTIEVESVCDKDTGTSSSSNGDHIRLEVANPGPGSRFTIQTAEEVARQEEEEEELAQQQQQALEHDAEAPPVVEEALQLRRTQRRQARAKELAYMPGGLYQPYKGYSRVMVQAVSKVVSKETVQDLEDKEEEGEVDIDHDGKIDRIQLKHKAVGRARSRRQPGGKRVKAHHSRDKQQHKMKKKSKHGHGKHGRGKKQRLGGGGGGGGGEKDKKHGHGHGHGKKHGRGGHHHHKGRGGRDEGEEEEEGHATPPPSGSSAPSPPAKPQCMPRILGLIPSGFNPWMSRTDSSEENQVQVFYWAGDLLLENHAAVAAERAGPDGGAAFAAGKEKDEQGEIETQDKDMEEEKKKKKRKHHRHGDKEEIGEAAEEAEEETRELPNGRYRLVVKTIKPWGIRGRASDVERWSSPIIVVHRR